MTFPASGEQNDGMGMIRGLDNTTTWYPLRPYGPGGLAKSINVAAGNNSGGAPTFDAYSSRGPGVDIVGRGMSTWSAGHLAEGSSYSADPVMADGYRSVSYTHLTLPTKA